MKKNIPATKSLLTDSTLFAELSQLIEQSQRQVASYANSTLTILFWHIGKRINEEVLDHKRADYGKQILPAISAKLEEKIWPEFYRKKCTENDAVCQSVP